MQNHNGSNHNFLKICMMFLLLVVSPINTLATQNGNTATIEFYEEKNIYEDKSDSNISFKKEIEKLPQTGEKNNSKRKNLGVLCLFFVFYVYQRKKIMEIRQYYFENFKKYI